MRKPAPDTKFLSPEHRLSDILNTTAPSFVSAIQTCKIHSPALSGGLGGADGLHGLIWRVGSRPCRGDRSQRPRDKGLDRRTLGGGEYNIVLLHHECVFYINRGRSGFVLWRFPLCAGSLLKPRVQRHRFFFNDSCITRSPYLRS